MSTRAAIRVTRLRQGLAAAGLAFAAAAAWDGPASATAYTFTTIDVGGSAALGTTVVSGINNAGQIIGHYVPNPIADDADQPAFVLTGGQVATIDPGGDSYSVVLTTINNLGQVAGHTLMAVGVEGYVSPYALPSSLLPVLPPVPYLAHSDNTINGINDLGQAVGQYVGSNDALVPYISTPGQGIVSGIPGLPSYIANSYLDSFVIPAAINNEGQIAGSYVDANGAVNGVYQGFVDTNGSFAAISVPGASTTSVTGINNAGVLTGDYILDGTQYGFVDAGGSFTTLEVSGAAYTDAEGINDLGQVAGTYDGATGAHGFVATPVTAVPEPASVTLLGAGAAAMGLALARRRRTP